MNETVTTNASNSATTMEYQMPSISNIIGRKITAATWKTRVLINDINAEIRPLLRAVKNDEPNIAIPLKTNENEKI